LTAAASAPADTSDDGGNEPRSCFAAAGEISFRGFDRDLTRSKRIGPRRINSAAISPSIRSKREPLATIAKTNL